VCNIVYDTVRMYGFVYRKFGFMYIHLGKIRSAETGKECAILSTIRYGCTDLCTGSVDFMYRHLEGIRSVGTERKFFYLDRSRQDQNGDTVVLANSQKLDEAGTRHFFPAGAVTQAVSKKMSGDTSFEFLQTPAAGGFLAFFPVHCSSQSS
jgi:hypothetical protein